MTNNQDAASAPRLNTKALIAGGALIGLGGLIGLAGAMLSGSALVAAARRRMQQMETPPRELAKHKWAQARSATTEGVAAWQRNGATAARQSPPS